ncbi:HNH homing endonuclease [Pectobacterium phage PcCB7V]|nr:HNH homing endonuclease [Pectobacterium phage PcCB7V]
MKIYIPCEKELALIRQYLYIDLTSKTELRWRLSPGPRSRAGSEAMTTKTANGYFAGRFLNRPYLCHRVVFFLDKGYWPGGIIDHVDRNKENNEPGNLREVGHLDNGANKIARGYYWSKEKSRWKAVVKCGSRVYTKLTSSETEAREWYEKKKLELYPHLNRNFYWNS